MVQILFKFIPKDFIDIILVAAILFILFGGLGLGYSQYFQDWGSTFLLLAVVLYFLKKILFK